MQRLINFKLMKTKFYLDCRKSEIGTLKIAISHKTETRHIPLDIHITQEQWDGKAEKIVNHKNKQFLNTYITRKKLEIDTAILKLKELPNFKQMNINDIKSLVIKEISHEEETAEQANNFVERFRHFAATHKQHTEAIYLHTLKRMTDFYPDLNTLTFEDINKDWLVTFDNYLSKTMPSKNARNVHLRNIRAVFNDAIDNEITSAYPFRKFAIRPTPTAKRSLTVQQLRTLFTMEVEPYAKIYQDLFKLAFMMLGINLIDLCNLKRDNVVNGRVEYIRAKTNKQYSIKIEPEMEILINRYRGKNFLLNILDTRKDYKNFLKQMNKALKSFGDVKLLQFRKKEKSPLFPNLSYYWCRHSWATIASELDIPKETIAHALGHGNNTVTDIYINYDMKKVDRANRQVIDYVLYALPD